MALLGTLGVRLTADTAAFRAGLQSAATSIKQVQADVAIVGATMMAFGAKINGAIGGAVNTFANFEQSMARVGAVSRASAETLDEMSTAARDMAQATEFSASQVADGMGFLAMAGFDAKQTIAAMPSVLQLSSAGMVDLASAADTTSNILTGMGMRIKDLGPVNDALVATMTRSNTDLQQLGQAFKYVGPVAQAAGVEFNEVSTALGLLGNAGIQASMAGTTLRGIISRLLNSTGEAADTLGRLGIETMNAEGNFVGLRSIIEQFSKSGAEASDILTVFGDRAGPGMAALISQGVGAFDQLQTAIEESAGSAAELATKQMATFAGQVKILESKAEEASISIGDSLAPAISVLNTALGAALDLFNSLPKWMKTTLAVGAALTGVVVSLGGAFALAMAALPSFLAALGTLQAVILPGLISGFIAFAPVLLPIVAIAGAVAAAIWGVNKAMQATAEAEEILRNKLFDDEGRMKALSMKLKAELEAEVETTGPSLITGTKYEKVLQKQEAAMRKAADAAADANDNLITFSDNLGDGFDAAAKAAGELSARLEKLDADLESPSGLMGPAMPGIQGVGQARDTAQSREAEKAKEEAAKRSEWAANNASAAFEGATANLGEFGGAVNAAAQGFASGGPWGAVIALIAELIGKLAAFRKISDILNNSLTFTVELLNDFLEPIVPLFEGLAQFVNVLTAVIAAIGKFGGVLEVVSLVAEGLSFVFKWVAAGIGNGIARFLDGISYLLRKIWLDDWADAIDRGSASIRDAVSMAENASSSYADQANEDKQDAASIPGFEASLGGLAETAEKLNSELSNVPQGFKINLRRFQAITGETALPATVGGASPFGALPDKPSGPMINQLILAALDPDDLLTRFGQLESRREYANRGTVSGRTRSRTKFSVRKAGA